MGLENKYKMTENDSQISIVGKENHGYERKLEET